MRLADVRVEGRYHPAGWRSTETASDRIRRAQRPFSRVDPQPGRAILLLDMAGSSTTLSDLPRQVREAVRFYWRTRNKQLEKQANSGSKDQGLRSAVTGGAQMDGFIDLLTRLVLDAGIERNQVFCNESLELPGYFRPTKKWDFLVVVEGQLVAALEAKSQVGPSFGNNFNNRTEEAMGSAVDLWTAFRERPLAAGSDLGSATCFSSMTVHALVRQWRSRSHISRCLKSFATRRTLGATNSFAAAWS